MAPHLGPAAAKVSRRGRRGGRAAPFAILAGTAATLWHWGQQSGPAYSVKGAWEGDLSTLRAAAKGDLGEVVAGLEPVVSFPPVSYTKGGIGLSAQDGHLNAEYTTRLDGDTSVNFRVNDEKAWIASLLGKDSSLRVRGEGADLDALAWEASKASSVDDLGDVQVDFNSDKKYNLTLTRDELASIAGASLGAKVHATNAGITGRLAAHRPLPGGAALQYSVENPVGVYDFGSSNHAMRLSAPVAGGEAALRAEGDSAAQLVEGSYTRGLGGGVADMRVSHQDGAIGYNVSWARSSPHLVAGVDSAAQIGADEDGLYTKLTATGPLSKQLHAEYEALGRLGLGEDGEKQLRQALKVSNKLGFAEVSHATGEGLKTRLGYEFSA